MTPQQFVKKWRPIMLTERAAAHSHFNDLCELLDHPKPLDVDPTGDEFTFEKGVKKAGGGDGFADVWKRGYFAWEYKKKKRNLDDALGQLSRYALALENPPLHVVCDTDRFRIVTAYTNCVPKSYDLALEDLLDSEKRSWLEAAFHSPLKLKPGANRSDLTKEAADKFSTLAHSLQTRGHSAPEISHFINQIVFLFFAEDVGLLKDSYFRKVLATLTARPKDAKLVLDEIFAILATGGRFGLDRLPWINGGLFDGRGSLELKTEDIGLLKAASSQDWGHIDPTIFGTLFERFLDPDKRSQIGAHYTDLEKIMKIVGPVLIDPLKEEWSSYKCDIEKAVFSATKSAYKSSAKHWRHAEELRSQFLEKLKSVSILDPACGSGNFLYVALREVKGLEHTVNQECEAFGLPPRWPVVGPEILHGIEINPVAAELAKTTIWIGDIQWGVQNGFSGRQEPILRKLDNIECCDALLDKNGLDKSWPAADFIIGNPPFLGGKRMKGLLGDEHCETLFRVFAEKVQPEADLVSYWVAKASEVLAKKAAARAGFVLTNSIRGGASRRVLEPLAKAGFIFNAWSDEPWTLEGASVRVSVVCWTNTETLAPLLNGKPTQKIHSDLTGGGDDLTSAHTLPQNSNVAFMGVTKGGAFDVSGETARKWLQLPSNVNNLPNAYVLRRRVSGLDITRRSQDMWLIDFGSEMIETQVQYFSKPYAHVKELVYPTRMKNNREVYRKFWWRHVEARPALTAKIKELKRYLATTIHAKYRIFAWQEKGSLPDNAVIAFARDDDFFAGVLQSVFHETWALALGSSLEDRPRYTPSTTFETFPFPEGLSPEMPIGMVIRDPRALAISTACAELMRGREAWLNPSDLVTQCKEVVVGYSNRVVPRDAEAALTLRSRTMTALYNLRGTPEGAWLDHLHSKLDEAVANAYGWSADITKEQMLSKLFALNLKRSGVLKPVFASTPSTSGSQAH